MKWNPKVNTKFPKAFVDFYKPIKMEIINRENYWKFLDDNN